MSGTLIYVGLWLLADVVGVGAWVCVCQHYDRKAREQAR